MTDRSSFLVVKYPQADTALEALDVLKQLAKEKVVKLNDAVAITKTAKGKIKLHQTKDDSTAKGFLKGGLIGVVFAALFGPAGWIAAGALVGGAFATFDRGVKNKLLKELGEEMSPDESAVAILVEEADWLQAVERMRAHNFKGEVVVMQIVEEDLAEVEALINEKEAVAAEEYELPAPVEEVVTAKAVEAVVADAAPPPDVPTDAPFEVVEVPPVEQDMRHGRGLEYIEGVGEVYSQKLFAAGVTSIDALLDKGSTPKGRQELGETTGISDKLILRWVNMADLYRIKGIGQEYAELLEAAGVDTVPELAQRVPSHLLEKVEAANAQRKMVRRLPVLSQVESWVEQAKILPRIITY